MATKEQRMRLRLWFENKTRQQAMTTQTRPTKCYHELLENYMADLCLKLGGDPENISELEAER